MTGMRHFLSCLAILLHFMGRPEGYVGCAGVCGGYAFAYALLYVAIYSKNTNYDRFAPCRPCLVMLLHLVGRPEGM